MSVTEEDTGSSQARQWEHGWEEHEQLQLRRLAVLPLTDKIAWLEDAHRIVMRLTKTEKLKGQATRFQNS